MAYLELMLRLDDLRRIFGAPQTLDERALAAGTIGRAMGQAVGEIQRAYFSVFLVAPRNVQALAGAAWDAAWEVHDWFDSGGPSPEDLSELRKRLVVFGQKARHSRPRLEPVKVALCRRPSPPEPARPRPQLARDPELQPASYRTQPWNRPSGRRESDHVAE